MDDSWVTAALHTGTLGAVALHLDRGRVAGSPELGSVAAAVVHRYHLRSGAHLNDILTRYRDTHFHLLGLGEREDLLRCLHREREPGFSAVATTYPALKRYLNEQQHTLSGGGADAAYADDASVAFEKAFGDGPVSMGEDEKGIPRRRPATWNRDVRWGDDDDDGESVLSTFSVRPS
jgi:hypothetical protein